jgi:hypothetical protein
MDTEWFAVDRDGHVAFFDSGEAGAVPADACYEERTGMLRQLEAIVPRTEPVYELRGRSGLREEVVHRMRLPDDETVQAFGANPRPTLMFVTSLEAVREEIDKGLAVPVLARDAAAVFFPSLPVTTNRKLHESGACLGCFWNNPTLYHDLPERLGLYHYKHPNDLYIPEPYGRHGSPRRPLHVVQLPTALLEILLRVRFDGIRFEETGRVQPIEHARCRCWYAGGYVGVDGQSIRPIPGEEELYRQEHEQLSEDLGLPAEPPPG